MATPFERTVCACSTCVGYCKKPGPLIPDDLVRLTDEGINVRDTLVPSRGGFYGRRLEDGSVQMIRVPTITPRKVNGRCVFLFADRCMIHDVAPFGCAYFDAHMDVGEANRRSVWMAARQSEPAYQSFRESLTEVE